MKIPPLWLPTELSDAEELAGELFRFCQQLVEMLLPGVEEREGVCACVFEYVCVCVCERACAGERESARASERQKECMCVWLCACTRA